MSANAPTYSLLRMIIFLLYNQVIVENWTVIFF